MHVYYTCLAILAYPLGGVKEAYLSPETGVHSTLTKSVIYAIMSNVKGWRGVQFLLAT